MSDNKDAPEKSSEAEETPRRIGIDPAELEVPMPGPDEVVPRLPRGKLFRWQVADLIRIGMFVTLLVAIIVMRKPCSEGVAGFIESFDPAPDAAPPTLHGYERLTEEEIKRRFPETPPAPE